MRRYRPLLALCSLLHSFTRRSDAPSSPPTAVCGRETGDGRRSRALDSTHASARATAGSRRQSTLDISGQPAHTTRPSNPEDTLTRGLQQVAVLPCGTPKSMLPVPSAQRRRPRASRRPHQAVTDPSHHRDAPWRTAVVSVDCPGCSLRQGLVTGAL